MPRTPAVPSFFQSLKNAVAFATYETSIGLVRSMDDVAQVTMRELDDLTKSLPVTTPWVIVTTDVHDRDWFMNWRILRYYAPQANIIVASHQTRPRHALLVRRNQTIASWTGDTVDIELPEGARVIWLLEPNAPFQKALEQVQRVERRRQLIYTDLPPKAAPFEVFDFRFVPKPLEAVAMRSSN